MTATFISRKTYKLSTLNFQLDNYSHSMVAGGLEEMS